MVKSKSRILIILSVNPACLELAAIKNDVGFNPTNHSIRYR